MLYSLDDSKFELQWLMGVKQQVLVIMDGFFVNFYLQVATGPYDTCKVQEGQPVVFGVFPDELDISVHNEGL